MANPYAIIIMSLKKGDSFSFENQIRDFKEKKRAEVETSLKIDSEYAF